jgi:hypothetical protein
MTHNTFKDEWVRDGLNEAVDNLRNDAPCHGHLSSTEILCFILGWQGGTIHQVAQQLDVTNDLILNADYEVMQWLCRLAQLRRPKSPDPFGEALNSGDGSYKP